MGVFMANRNKHAAGSRLTVWLVAMGFVFLGATTGCTGTMTVGQVGSATTQTKKPKHDASGKHRHEHCHIKGNGKNKVCHDHPHGGGVHH